MNESADILSSRNDAPKVFCGYEVVRELSPGRTYLAHDASNRKIVLKRLESDYLLLGKLHPSIRERLERVRELPVTCAAGFLGVERCDNDTALVWEYIEGESLEQFQKINTDAVATQSSPLQTAANHACDWDHVFRSVRSAVATLHRFGIVHGAIKPTNIIIRPDASVILTHISPLLYNDPADDEAAVARIFQTQIPQKQDKLSSQDDASPRKRAYLQIGAVVAIGIIISIAIALLVLQRHGGPP